MGVMNRMMNFLGLQEDVEELEPDMERYDEREHEQEQPQKRRNKGNIVSIHAQQTSKIVLSEPKSYEDTQLLADHLRSRRAVIVNMQRARQEHAGRIVDFLSGTVYALNGHISKIGPNIFLCTPDNMDIQGEIAELYLNDDENMR